MTELVGGHRGTVAQRTADAGVAPVWVVPLSDVHAGQELQEAVLAAVRSGWWSAGPRVAEFERAFADLCRTRHAIAVANGTAALHLALLAVGCGPGDEVVIPSLNFVAGANAIGHIGASAVFCDICGEDDLTLDPRDLEAAISPATKAIVVMHYGGHPCRMDEILDIADRRGITVIEDAAHAPGATLAGRPCGAMGAIGCFSFFSNKNLPMGEGGMVVTDDDELERTVRLLRSHGMTTVSWERHKGHATRTTSSSRDSTSGWTISGPRWAWRSCRGCGMPTPLAAALWRRTGKRSTAFVGSACRFPRGPARFRPIIWPSSCFRPVRAGTRSVRRSQPPGSRAACTTHPHTASRGTRRAGATGRSHGPMR